MQFFQANDLKDAGSKHTPALSATGHFKNQGTMDSALNKPPK